MRSFGRCNSFEPHRLVSTIDKRRPIYIGDESKRSAKDHNLRAFLYGVWALRTSGIACYFLL
jgi:hypothetical protein